MHTPAVALNACDLRREFGGGSSGVGSDVMKPIAAPVIGGMVTSTIHVLIITPFIFCIVKLRSLRRERFTVSVTDG